MLALPERLTSPAPKEGATLTKLISAVPDKSMLPSSRSVKRGIFPVEV